MSVQGFQGGMLVKRGSSEGADGPLMSHQLVQESNELVLTGQRLETRGLSGLMTRIDAATNTSVAWISV